MAKAKSPAPPPTPKAAAKAKAAKGKAKPKAKAPPPPKADPVPLLKDDPAPAAPAAKPEIEVDRTPVPAKDLKETCITQYWPKTEPSLLFEKPIIRQENRNLVQTSMATFLVPKQEILEPEAVEDSSSSAAPAVPPLVTEADGKVDVKVKEETAAEVSAAPVEVFVVAPKVEVKASPAADTPTLAPAVEIPSEQGTQNGADQQTETTAPSPTTLPEAPQLPAQEGSGQERPAHHHQMPDNICVASFMMHFKATKQCAECPAGNGTTYDKIVGECIHHLSENDTDFEVLLRQVMKHPRIDEHINFVKQSLEGAEDEWVFGDADSSDPIEDMIGFFTWLCDREQDPDHELRGQKRKHDHQEDQWAFDRIAGFVCLIFVC